MSDVEAAAAARDGRRRVIDLALSRRPDMTVGELHQVLRRLGMRVTSETVIDDLDGLGYRVEDGGRVALATDDGDRRLDEARGRDLETLGRKGRWASRLVPALVVLAAVVALVAAALAVISLVDDDDPGTQDRGTVTTAASSSTPADGVDATEGSAPEARLTDATPDVEVAFEGEGALPPPGELGPWAPGRGGWFLADGEARVDPPGEDEAVTYFAGPTPDLIAEITLPEASPGAGIAFRLGGDTDYLAWTLSPDGGGVQLVRVAAAIQTLLLGPELDVQVAPGVELGVRAAGADLELSVDGEVVTTTADTGPLDRAGVGLVALGTVEVPAFDDLRVTFLPEGGP